MLFLKVLIELRDRQFRLAESCFESFDAALVRSLQSDELLLPPRELLDGGVALLLRFFEVRIEAGDLGREFAPEIREVTASDGGGRQESALAGLGLPLALERNKAVQLILGVRQLALELDDLVVILNLR